MRDHKLVWLTQFVDVALLVHFVGLLVVDKQVGGTLACHPTKKCLGPNTSRAMLTQIRLDLCFGGGLGVRDARWGMFFVDIH